MGFIDKEGHWAIEALGLVFIIVGASKWLYDVIFLNNFLYWKIYLVMLIVGVLLMGYMKIGKALISIKTGR